MLDRAGRSRRIAVVGGGISGLGAAWHLLADHEVTLIEAAPQLGGHARTVMAGRRGDQPVDTGFIVFNRPNYPHLCRLFQALDVPVTGSDMSFSASIGAGWLEYGLKDWRAVIAQRRNLARPAFWGMISDILRFNARAKAAARPGMRLGDLLDALGTGAWFRDHYIGPLSGAIWSTPAADILDFPAAALVGFFDNHALLSHRGQHRWLTVRGGSREYVTRLEAALRVRGVTIRTGTAAERLCRGPAGPELRLDGHWAAFDEVVLAVHGDAALRLLGDPSAEERAALGAVRYQDNRAVLHADPSVMPRRRACWSSWNYRDGGAGGAIALSYWMNALQPIPKGDPMFVTLNTEGGIDPGRIYDVTTFRHPLYDEGLLAAQARIRALNGARGTWYCGAWMKNGFHEDGLASAVEVAQRMTRAQAAA